MSTSFTYDTEWRQRTFGRCSVKPLARENIGKIETDGLHIDLYLANFRRLQGLHANEHKEEYIRKVIRHCQGLAHRADLSADR